ncbi:MAG: NAD(+)/NADH kinase [Methanomassiliicoccales archaeon]
MKLGLTANVNVPDAPRLARMVCEYLEGQELILEEAIATVLGRKGVRIEDMKVDVMITIGGDGTILRALMRNEAPIFGINAGDLGFLTEIQEDMLEEGLERVIRGQYHIEERSKLRSELAGKRLRDATNEVVVHTAHIAKLRHFRVFVDGELAIDVKADGIIVSTPTGSTCYAMSVGAPILDPRVDALVIAPMAPFKFAGRPTVVPANSDISIEIQRPKPCLIVVDGQEEVSMEGNEELHFTTSDKKARFVSLGRTFYTKMREKLTGGPCWA